MNRKQTRAKTKATQTAAAAAEQCLVQFTQDRVVRDHRGETLDEYRAGAEVVMNTASAEHFERTGSARIVKRGVSKKPSVQKPKENNGAAASNAPSAAGNAASEKKEPDNEKAVTDATADNKSGAKPTTEPAKPNTTGKGS